MNLPVHNLVADRSRAVFRHGASMSHLVVVFRRYSIYLPAEFLYYFYVFGKIDSLCAHICTSRWENWT